METPGHTGHTGARGQTDHTDEPHNHPPKPKDTGLPVQYRRTLPVKRHPGAGLRPVWFLSYKPLSRDTPDGCEDLRTHGSDPHMFTVLAHSFSTASTQIHSGPLARQRGTVGRSSPGPCRNLRLIPSASFAGGPRDSGRALDPPPLPLPPPNTPPQCRAVLAAPLSVTRSAGWYTTKNWSIPIPYKFFPVAKPSYLGNPQVNNRNSYPLQKPLWVTAALSIH